MLYQTVEHFVDSPWIGVKLGQKRIASEIVRNCGRKKRASFSFIYVLEMQTESKPFESSLLCIRVVVSP